MAWEVMEDEERKVLAFFCNTDGLLVGPLIDANIERFENLDKATIYHYWNNSLEPRTMSNNEIEEELIRISKIINE